MSRLLLLCVLSALLASSLQEGLNGRAGDSPTCKPAELQSVHVVSIVTSRFARTRVISRAHNDGDRARHSLFHVLVPKGAFISNFSMTVDGKTYLGSVKDRLQAKLQYQRARQSHLPPVLLRSPGRDVERFMVGVSLAPGSTVQFELCYDELLRRQLGRYEHTLSLRTAQRVQTMQVDVYVMEPKGISFIHVPPIPGIPSNIINITHSNNKAHIRLRPCPPAAVEGGPCPGCSSAVLEGSMAVRYDVKRELSAGDVQISNGYFAHFIAPANIPPTPKNIVFIIDVSGSMWGLKMKQTQQALSTILSELRPDDHFSIIRFDHRVEAWTDELMQASACNVDDAKKYVQGLQAEGGTNINEAVLRAVEMLCSAKLQGSLPERSTSILVLLTDGDPTVGVIDLAEISANVKAAMAGNFSLFALGFGFDVDYDFLERLALENRGIARRILADNKADAQLKGFYDEVATPLLSRVAVHYAGAPVSALTQTSFDNYFHGAELVVAGKTAAHATGGPKLSAHVTAESVDSDLTLDVVADAGDTERFLSEHRFTDPTFAERLWAFLTINQLLLQRTISLSAQEKSRLSQRALDLSLRYGFVTPLTAMVLTVPNAPKQNLVGGHAGERKCCVGRVPPGQTPQPYQPEPDPPCSPPKQCPPLVKTPPTVLPVGITPRPPHVVDNDPHFIIALPKWKVTVCFNVDEEPGKIINLVSDPERGVVVNAELVGAKRPEVGATRLATYLGRVAVAMDRADVTLNVGTDDVVVAVGNGANNGSGVRETTLPWATGATITHGSVRVHVEAGRRLTVLLDERPTFVVVLHRVWKGHQVHRDFLGFYTVDQSLLSASTHGLIGQFFAEPEVAVFNTQPGEEPGKPTATMLVKGHKLKVTRGVQKNHLEDAAQGDEVPCWFVHNNGHGLIDGRLSDYLLPELFSRP
ncbi:inter-alpha-trypsin inhibitor heavy chain H2 [Petromyzon marinus]|uniref:inter-alpha-trypsin inhibitor heavy chain H2 n=1 Tax=Petromyzon marinus TaxID=7757 RepID=UPI003F72CCEF